MPPPPMQLTIREDDLTGPEIAVLLTAHLELMASQGPPESTHALDLDALRAPGITFWTIWEAETLMGCGALKTLDATHGEIKSMHTAAVSRGKGIGARMLTHIIDDARRRGLTRLSLETGSMAAFAPARGLYERFGFIYCAPFADYVPDPNSVFMTRELAA